MKKYSSMFTNLITGCKKSVVYARCQQTVFQRYSHLLNKTVVNIWDISIPCCVKDESLYFKLKTFSEYFIFWCFWFICRCNFNTDMWNSFFYLNTEENCTLSFAFSLYFFSALPQVRNNFVHNWKCTLRTLLLQEIHCVPGLIFR